MIRRLSAYDLHCLRVESPARPLHIGVLAVLDGGRLCDEAGRLRLTALREAIEGRLAKVPQLRRVIHHPGLLAGRPLWIDDPAFRIERHVDEVRLAPGADGAALLAVTEHLMAPLLDRARPLWRLSFVTGLGDGRVGLLIVIHHALADGLTAMHLARSLLEPASPSAGPTDGSAPAGFAGPPAWASLVGDNARASLASAVRLVLPGTWRGLIAAVRSARQALAVARAEPRTSLNAPVGPRRRLATIRLDKVAARQLAQVHGCGINDVVLDLVAGGLRAILAVRGEPVERLRPRAGVAVALFSPKHRGGAGNDIGSLLVPLPLAEPDPVVRLAAIAGERARAKGTQVPAAEPKLRASLARLRFVRRSLERQQVVNIHETYLPGPPAVIELLGAPALDLLPIAPLAGNIGLSFVGLSYAGRLTVTIRADADRFADLPVLVAAMERDWQALAASVAADRGQDAA